MECVVGGVVWKPAAIKQGSYRKCNINNSFQANPAPVSIRDTADSPWDAVEECLDEVWKIKSWSSSWKYTRHILANRSRYQTSAMR